MYQILWKPIGINMKTFIFLVLSSLSLLGQPFIKWERSSNLLKSQDKTLQCKLLTGDLKGNNLFIAQSSNGFSLIKFNDIGIKIWEKNYGQLDNSDNDTTYLPLNLSLYDFNNSLNLPYLKKLPSSNFNFAYSFFAFDNIDDKGNSFKQVINQNDTTLLQKPQGFPLNMGTNKFVVVEDYFLFDSVSTFIMDSSCKVYSEVKSKPSLMKPYIAQIKKEYFNMPYLYFLYGDNNSSETSALIKTDLNGVKVWSVNLNNINYKTLIPISFVEMRDRSLFTIHSLAKVINDKSEYIFQKVSENGNIISTKKIVPSFEHSVIYNSFQINDTIYCVGTNYLRNSSGELSNRQFYLLVINKDLDIITEKTWGDPNRKNVLEGCTLTGINDLLVTGNIDNSDYYIARIASGIVASVEESVTQKVRFENQKLFFTNPDEINSIILTNLLGQVEFQANYINSNQISVESLNKGIYFAKIELKNGETQFIKILN